MNQIGKRIKDRRKKLGLTQEELAGRIGKNANLYSRYERGEVKMNTDTIANIARELNISVSELMGEECITETAVDCIPTMSYWGSVLDNIRQLVNRGDMTEIMLVYPLLKSGYEMLTQSSIFTNTNNLKHSLLDIRQNNVGRDATVNVGTVQK